MCVNICKRVLETNTLDRKKQLEESENKHPLSALTSICHIELDSKVTARASGVVTSCEDDPADGLDLPDDAGNSRGGQEAIVADYQAANLHSTNINEEQCQLHINQGCHDCKCAF